MRYFKRILAVLILVSMATLALSSCERKTDIVVLEIEDYGDIVIMLYPKIAPITVKNFQNLVKKDFYDGLTFHRIADLSQEGDYIIQGGDPRGDGTGSSDKKIKGEFAANGVKNNLSHKRGVISMARSNAFNSASCQFFICAGDCSFLDGSYAAFGEVIEGMDVVDAIAQAPCYGSTPITTITITRAYFR